ncbi:hypothetical protein KAR48_11740 [bacterium]|nr:hypothetical protein [bacterium]
MKKIMPIGFLLIVMLAGCQGGASFDAERVRAYANALYNRDLYSQAIDVYDDYLNLGNPNKDEAANIQYVVGGIYFDRLHDYENALARYLYVKHLHPESLLTDKVSRRIVECLERLNRSADARQALSEATTTDPTQVQQSRPGEVLAVIGDKKITQGDLDYRIIQMPEYMRSQFDKPEARREFLRNLVATELFFGAAGRQGLEKDPDVIEGAFQARKQLMVQKYLEKVIVSEVPQLTQEDVKLYFDAHRDRYAEKDNDGKVSKQKSFNEAAQQAAQDLMRERQDQAVQKLLQQMKTAEGVKIYESLVK